jgi:hypothetical protein
MHNVHEHRKELDAVVEVVRQTASPLVSLFGAGHWFTDETCPSSDIDLIAIVRPDDNANEADLHAALVRSGHERIGGLPVKIRLFWLDELLGNGVGKCAIAGTRRALRVFIRHFPYYALLYGREWPVSEGLLPPLPAQEEFHYWKELFSSFEEAEVLDLETRPERFRNWQYFLKAYIFCRVAAAAAFAECPYVYSFRRFEELCKARPEDLIHTAFRYRRALVPVPHDERLTFRKRALEELAIMESREVGRCH